MKPTDLIASYNINDRQMSYTTEEGQNDILRIIKRTYESSSSGVTVWEFGDFVVHKYVLSIPASEFQTVPGRPTTYVAHKDIRIDPTEQNFYPRLFAKAEILHSWGRPTTANRDIPIVGTATIEGMSKRDFMTVHVATTTRVATNIIVTIFFKANELDNADDWAS